MLNSTNRIQLNMDLFDPILLDIVEYRKKYYRENKARIWDTYQQTDDYKTYQKNYHKQHMQKQLERNKKWREANKDHIHKHDADYRNRIKNELIRLLGEVCQVCKTTQKLQIDHRFGGGFIDKRKFKYNGTSMYRFYLENPDLALERLQILCAYHNQEKRTKLQECGKKYVAKCLQEYN